MLSFFYEKRLQKSWYLKRLVRLTMAFAMSCIDTEEGMTIHSSIFTWRMPWTEEPGRLQSMQSQRV